MIRGMVDSLVAAFNKDPMDVLMGVSLFILTVSGGLLVLVVVAGLACGAIR